MRKEVLVAIILGGILGLTIAFGVWRANLALSPKQETPKVATSDFSSPTPSPGMLLITEPEENSLVGAETITLKGKAQPRSSIVATTTTDSTSTLADNSGSWTADVKLESGANEVMVMAVGEDGEENSVTLTVTYSTEFKEE